MKHPELSGACAEARDWAKKFDSLEAAWAVCERTDWVLWWIRQVAPEDRRLHAIGCDCAERALRFVPPEEDRPRQAIETKRRWLRGEGEKPAS